MRPALIITSLVLLLAISVPYFIADKAPGREYVFGGFLLNPIDGNSYLAKMYQGWRGGWKFNLPFNQEPGSGAFIFLFYISLGHLARLTGLPLLLVFHLARLISSLILLFELHRFIRHIVNSLKMAGFLFTWVVLGSGLGWLGLFFGAFTTDFWVAEAYPFLAMYSNPHFPLGLALMLRLLESPGKAISQARLAGFGRSLMLVMASMALALCLPFGSVQVLMFLGGWIIVEGIIRRLLKKKPLGEELALASAHTDPLFSLGRRYLLIIAGCLPVLGYDYWATISDPILSGWNAQNITLTPAGWDILIAFSPAILLALVSARWSIPSYLIESRGVLVWFLLGFLLLYIPLDLQRRFITGWYIPVVCLAVIGLEKLWRQRGEINNVQAIFLIMLSLPTNVIILLTGMYGIRTHDPLLYLSRDEALALRWIADNSFPDDLILASPEMGLFIPAHTGRRVIYGHPFETVEAEKKKQEVISFFAGCGGCEKAYLFEKGVDYIFYGPREKELGVANFGIPVFISGDVEVFRVKN